MMDDIKAYLVPFSHLDLFWLGAQEECLSRGNRIISEAMEMAARHPEFRFLLEDLVFVDHFLCCHPEKKAELKELVRKGQIEIGPKWAGIDQTPQAGEDLVRNSLYALDYLEKVFDYAPQAIQASDLAGWTPQYPQILQKLGIPFAVYTRTGPGDASLFNWVGIDGTKILVWYARHDYGWAWHDGGLDISVERAVENGLEREMAEVLSQGVEPIFVHWGVDLILPGKRLPANLKRWNEASEIKMAFATPTEYFEQAPKTGLRELAGEAPTAWIYSDPQYPSYMSLALPAVAALLTGEKFSTIAWLKGFIPSYPTAEIKEAWLQVLEAMDHNNNGQGHDFTLERKLAYYQSSIHGAERLTEDALRRVAEKVEAPFGAECRSIVVFNPMSWRRTEVVKAHVTYHGDIVAGDIPRYRQVKMVDEAGNLVDVQQTDVCEGAAREEYLSFTVRDIPACGYKAYYLLPAKEPPGAAPVCQQDGWTFSTPFYEVTCDKVTGDVSIKESASGRIVTKKMYVVGIEEMLGNNALRDEGTGRRYENIVEAVELVHNSTIFATIALKGTIGKSGLRQEITLYRDVRRIDIVNTVEFVEWRPMRLEQVFDTGMGNPAVVYGIPYGVNRLTNVIPNCAPRRGDERPTDSWRKHRNCIQWLDLTERVHGVTIGSKHRCFQIDGGTVSAVMLRAVVSHALVYIQDGRRMPHHRPPTGRYVFTYSLLPHEKGWAEAKAYRLGWEINHPLMPVSVCDTYSAKTLPSGDQFIHLDSTTDSLILTVCKKAEEGEDVILRFYETEGKAGKAALRFAGEIINNLYLCDLRERNIKELTPLEEIEYGPFEIITLRASRQITL